MADDDIPFETPPRRLGRVRRALRIPRHREKMPSIGAISLFVLVFALGAVSVGYLGSGLLLLAWLMAGPLAITIYLTFDGRGSLLNPYTLFFGAIVAGCVVANIALG
jgi:hypothetical protein